MWCRYIPCNVTAPELTQDPLRRWQHNCANLFCISHLETLIFANIPRCITIRFCYGNTTVASWDAIQACRLSDLYQTISSMETPHECKMHPSKMLLYLATVDEEEEEAMMGVHALCDSCLQMCDATVRNASSGATAHYRDLAEVARGCHQVKEHQPIPRIRTRRPFTSQTRFECFRLAQYRSERMWS